MPQFIRLTETTDIPTGQVRGFDLEGRRIGVANVDGEYYAFLATCPHRGGPLDQGHLWGFEIDCPHHHYMFDVRTGENVFPRRVFPPELAAMLKSLRTFRTRVRLKTVEIELLD
jgi:3-phenylpropionate/trans-cinnamate dioxygenase ferredoxin subunit